MTSSAKHCVIATCSDVNHICCVVCSPTICSWKQVSQMDRKLCDKVQMDVQIVLQMQDKKFVLSKRLLIERSEYFKAKFCGFYKDSKETSLQYPDISADAFSKVYDCLLGKGILQKDIQFPDIENALKVADFFCIDVFKQELQEILLKSWDSTKDPLRALRFAEEVFPESLPVLNSRCIRITHNILQTVTRYDPATAYELVLHAAQKDGFLNTDVFFNPYRFSECCVNTIRLVCFWLVKNSYTKNQICVLLNRLRLEMFPCTFLTDVIEGITASGRCEKTAKQLLLDCTKCILETVKNTIQQQIECVYILSSSYNYSKFCTADVADFNKFVPTFWNWQTDKIQMSEGSRVIHVHIIDKTAYLITSASLEIIDLKTMKREAIIVHKTLTNFLNNVWVNQIQVLTCHDENTIHIVPDEPENDFRSKICHPLKFDIASHSFTTLPHNPKSDIVIRAVISYEGKIYFAGLTNNIIIYSFDPNTNSYFTLYTVDYQEVFSNWDYDQNCLSTSICLGVWQNCLYAFCFSKMHSFYVTINLHPGQEIHAEMKNLQNEHFTKGWMFTKPYLCTAKDGFLIALQIHDCTPHPYTWDDTLLTLFRPKYNSFQLLGLLPRLNNDTGGRFGFGIQALQSP